jgi:hypothetical protein
MYQAISYQANISKQNVNFVDYFEHRSPALSDRCMKSALNLHSRVDENGMHVTAACKLAQKDVLQKLLHYEMYVCTWEKSCCCDCIAAIQ